ncbi:MAG: hypothetical protein FWG30_02840 [Eubacteriaceae bacterium]|nr:hypothetical protein [Eubacteriaceae bacterium]
MNKLKPAIIDAFLALAVAGGIGLNIYAYRPDSSAASESVRIEAPGTLGQEIEDSAGTNLLPSEINGAETLPDAQTQNSYSSFFGYAEGEKASIGDFFWFTESVKWDGLPKGRAVISDFSQVAGYWKAYTETVQMFEGEQEELEFFNVEISGDAANAKFTYHTKGFFGSNMATGEDYDVSFRDKEAYIGRFSGSALIAGDIDTKGVKINIMSFYAINGSQYGVGEITWISGEKQNIALVRP